jgi:hypothetical protein
LIKDKVRNFSFCLFPCDFIQEGVTEEASRKEALLLQQNDLLLNESLQLEIRFVLRDLDDTILGSLREELAISSQDDTALLTRQFEQLISIFSPVVNGIITQHP